MLKLDKKVGVAALIDVNLRFIAVLNWSEGDTFSITAVLTEVQQQMTHSHYL